jgi:hypothetical protein
LTTASRNASSGYSAHPRDGSLVRADAHISFEEILRLIDLLRQRAVKNTPVDEAPQAKLRRQGRTPPPRAK